MARLIDDLDRLHDRVAEAVNVAVASGDLARADQLAAEYDEEAIVMIAVHEGRTHQLPIPRPQGTDSRLRALLRLLSARPAA